MKNRSKFQIWIRYFVLVLITLTIISCDRAGMDDKQLLQSGKEYLGKRDLPAAAIELRYALQKNPENAEARYLLAQIYLKVGDAGSAQKEFKRASEAGWNMEEAQLGLAEALLRQNKFQELVDEFEAEDSWSMTARANLQGLRAAAAVGMQDHEQARLILSQGEKLQADAFHILKTRVQLQLLAGEITAGQNTLAIALNKYPGNPELLLLSANAKTQENNTAAAQELLKRVIESDPPEMITVNGRRARLDLTRLLILERSLDQAEQTIQPLLARNEADPEANYYGGMLAFAQGKYDLSEQYLLKILKIAPDHRPTLLLTGTVSYSQGEYEQAAYYLEKYLAAKPENIKARKLLGRAYMEIGQHEEARAALRSVLTESTDDAELLAMVGLSELKSGQMKAGIHELERAVAIAPDSATLHRELGKAYLSTGETDRAIKELELVGGDEGSQYQAKFLMVLAYLRANNLEKAIESTQEMLDARPDSPVFLNLMGSIQSTNNNGEEGRRYFEKALEIKPDYVNAAMNLARLEELEGKPEAAVKRYQEIVATSPDTVPALMALARLAKNEGNQLEQVKWLEKARSADKAELVARVTLAEYYLQKRDIPEVELLLGEMEAEHSDQPAVLAVKGRLLMAKGQYNRAVPVFESLIELLPEQAIGYYLNALNQLKLGQKQDARASLHRAHELMPEDLNVMVILARVELDTGDYEQAMKLSEVIKEVAPQSPAGYEIEGDALMGLQRYQQALDAYDAAWNQVQARTLLIKRFRANLRVSNDDSVYSPLLDWLVRHPDDVQVRVVLATTYDANDQTEKAVPHYEKILEVQPDNLAALNDLAFIYNAKGDPRALGLAERAYTINATLPAILDTYGWILLNSGQTDKALRLLTEAAEGLPNIPEVSYHYAVALYKAGRHEQAYERLSELLSTSEDFEGRPEAQLLIDQQ